MKNDNPSLITVITESALESQLVRELELLGAPGYTITNARGKGTRGVRDAAWEANSNIRIEVICSLGLANKIAEMLQEKYYENYAMVSYISDIQVLRPTKFTSEK
jgi:nitrogen regulatory protein PII